MADEETVVVEIEGEAPEGSKTETPVADPVIELKKQLETLESEKDAERQQREAAQRGEAEAKRIAVEASREAESARGQVAETRLSTVETGLASAQTEATAAEAAYAQAMSEGNFAEAAKQQRRMARAEAESVRLTEAKADLESARAAPAEQRREASPTQQADPVESFLAKCAPETARWLRAHPDEARILATQPTSRRAAKLQAADSDARAEGYDPGSNEYWKHVEGFLGMTQETKTNGANGTDNGQTQRKRAASPPVAPVQASGGGTSGGDNTVRLTPGEARAATDGTLVWNYPDPSGQNRWKKGDPIGHQEMARRKRTMKEQGLYDKSYYEA